jgi:DTW domain-containing protein YfiP
MLLKASIIIILYKSSKLIKKNAEKNVLIHSKYLMRLFFFLASDRYSEAFRLELRNTSMVLLPLVEVSLDSLSRFSLRSLQKTQIFFFLLRAGIVSKQFE